MSQLTKYIEAQNVLAYYFRIALDRIPEPDEKEQIKKNIRDAMESLGVPREQVAVSVFRSDVHSEVNTQEEKQPKIKGNHCYLICILTRGEPDVLQEDPDELSREIVTEFITYAEIDPDNVAAVIFENAYMEVETKTHSSHPGIW